MAFTLASWNTNFRRDVAPQVSAVLAHSPEIVVLQEVRAPSFPALAGHFAEAGLTFFATSSSSVLGHRMSRYVTVASCFPFRDAAPVEGPAPETSVCLEIESPDGRFELVGVYVPNIARRDSVKAPTQHAVNARMAHAAHRPHIICGDFNSPKSESEDGITLFCKPSRPEDYAGEQALMGGLLQYGLRDAFRECNGYADPSPSWFWKNRGRTGGYRLDHIFVSPHFQVRRCWYDHGVREGA